jgi:hypothetical protein
MSHVESLAALLSTFEGGDTRRETVAGELEPPGFKHGIRRIHREGKLSLDQFVAAVHSALPPAAGWSAWGDRPKQSAPERQAAIHIFKHAVKLKNQADQIYHNQTLNLDTLCGIGLLISSLKYFGDGAHEQHTDEHSLEGHANHLKQRVAMLMKQVRAHLYFRPSLFSFHNASPLSIYLALQMRIRALHPSPTPLPTLPQPSPSPTPLPLPPLSLSHSSRRLLFTLHSHTEPSTHS